MLLSVPLRDLRDLAVHDMDPAVGAGGQRGVVGHHDHGLALVGDVAQDREHLLGRCRVERAGRLVGDDDLGAVGERARDGDALALAAGELVGPLVRMLGKSERAEQSRPRSRISASDMTPAARIGSSTLSSEVNSGSRK